MRRPCAWLPILIAAALGPPNLGGTALGGQYPVESSDEIAEALTAVRPGDTIVLCDGPWHNVEVLFEAQGTAEKPITLRAQTPGKVVISGRSKLQIAGSHLVVEGLFFHRAYHPSDLIAFRRDAKRLSSDCRLTDCAAVDCNAPDGSPSTRWVSIYGERNRVDHCWIQGKTTQGATLVVWLNAAPNHHRIDHNHFGPRPELGKNGGETIRVGDSATSMSSSHTLVEYNCFEKCDGEAEIVSSKSCNNVYRYNTFLQCAGALTLRHGNRCVVEGNVFLGEKARGTGGVRIIGEGHRVVNNYFERLEGTNGRAALTFMGGIPQSPLHGYFQVKQAVVAFNTFVDCRQTVVVGLYEGDMRNWLPPEDCVVANNLIVGRRGPLVDLRMPPVRFSWEGNLVGGEGQLGAGDLDHGLRRVPIDLEPGASGLRRPAPGSPAIDAAQGDFPIVRDDIDGQPRTEPKDVGCDEHSTNPILRRPLQPKDIGPSWNIQNDN